MLIRQVRLQNIKSYTDQTVEFHEGVNFISGINGAGKSTIIEAIGYALFDCNPYPNIKDLIHYGAKSGTITINFCANDDRDYQVVRKIGTSTLWAVFDLETGGEIDLHGARDVREWLKESMGVDRDVYLDQLFQDVVGVPQGTFVGPFLETQSVRKKKFDTILKVEQFREAYNNTARVVSSLTRNLNEKDTELRVLAEQVRDYDTVKTEITALKSKVSELVLKLADICTQTETMEQTVKELEKIRLSLEKHDGDIKALEAKGKALEQGKQDREKSLLNAREAQVKLNSSEVGYKSYLVLEKNLKALDEERSVKEKLEKELNRLKQEIAAGAAAIIEKEKNLSEQAKELTAEHQSLTLQIHEISLLSSKANAELEEAKLRLSRTDAWRKAEDTLALLNSRLGKVKLDAAAKMEQLTILGEEEISLHEKLKEWPETEKLAVTYEDREVRLQQAIKEYHAANTRLKTLEENLQRSQGGLCPFLNSACQNVEGNLEEHFTEQIAQVRLGLEHLKDVGTKLRVETAAADEAGKKLIKLNGEKERLGQVLSQKTKLLAEVSGVLVTASAEPLEKALQQLSGEFQQSFSRAGECLSVFREFITDQLPELKISLLDNVLTCLEDVLAESKDNRSAQEKKLADEVNRRSATAAELDTGWKNFKNRLDQVTARTAKIADEQELLKKSAEYIDQKRSTLEEKEKALAGYADLEGRIAEARQQQESFRADYVIYMQNVVEAKKVPFLEKQFVDVSNQITENEKTLADLRNSYHSLQEKFDPENYTARKNELDNLKLEEATQRQILTERRADLTEQEQKLSQMEIVLAQMESLRQQVKTDRKTLSLLDAVRSILNSAGPPIARMYLENLSRTADELYRQVSRENVALEWREGYEIVLVDNFNGHKRERTFKQFSGGEQTTVALAVRLALLKQHSRVKLGFFDEPTSNLDSDRRLSLAETIPLVTGGFNQIFVISHDDTFDSITDNVIHIQKDPAEGSLLVE